VLPSLVENDSAPPGDGRGRGEREVYSRVDVEDEEDVEAGADGAALRVEEEMEQRAESTQRLQGSASRSWLSRATRQKGSSCRTWSSFERGVLAWDGILALIQLERVQRMNLPTQWE
jgi:hypothetical protein